MSMKAFTKVFCPTCLDVNQTVLDKFESLTDDDFKEKTHLFHGRYENLYLDEDKISELKIIIDKAVENAAEILNLNKTKLAYGFWLNAMEPNHVTTAHTHDDDDELLSCVYYIKVPENSGDLVITDDNEKTVIKPEEGMFVFFSPETLHEVTLNKSNEKRLSIAFNFGLRIT